MLGPLPPLTGGMATVTCNLRDSELAGLTHLVTLNNAKTTPEGRSVFAGVWAQSRLLLTVLSTIWRRRVQLVHIHTCALFSFWRDILHMITARLSGCCVVWHIHDGTFRQFISEGSSIKRAVIRWALRRGSAVIVLSQQSLENVRPYAANVRWRVVENGVPIGRETSASADDQLRLLFIGQLTERKGAYDLVAALETAGTWDVRPVLSLAGGEVIPGQRRKMEDRIAASPCANQIRLLGMIRGNEKEQAIQEANCIVLPSYAEGLPMALLEGMAAGMPAIATRVGSVPEVIRDGVDGYLVDIGDVVALADRITQLARDVELRRRMGRAAHKQVEVRFSVQEMAQRVYQIYCDVLSTNAVP
jgi:glycosyltransferase involved in cell wall biosynthesis